MKRLFLALLLLAQPASVFAAQAPETPLVTGPSMAQVPASQILITPTGGTTPVALGSLATEAGVLLDTFRVSGDPDDTLSMGRAVAANVPILLGSKTYTINNYSMSGTPANFILRGVPGKSIIQRTSSSGSNFFTISATNVVIDGVTFDSNKASVSANQWGVLLSTGGQTVNVRNSVFKNNSGTLGQCFALISTGPGAGGSFRFEGNEVTGCASNGTFFGSVSQGIIRGNYIHDNASFGLYVSSYTAASGSNYARDIIISDNTIMRNVNGLEAGGISSPYVYGTPAAVNITISNNQLQDNSSRAILAQGDNISIIGNKITQSATNVSVNTGINITGRYTLISDNDVNYANSSYGIDIGGSVDTQVLNNRVTVTTGVAINPGGGTNNTVRNNTLNVSGTAYAFTVYDIETDGSGVPFPLHTSALDIEYNIINLSGASASGFTLFDNAGGYSTSLPTTFQNNQFTSINSAPSANAVTYRAGAAALALGNNTWNGALTTFVNPNGNNDIVLSDVFDGAITFVGASTTIRAFITPNVNTYNAGGSILYVVPSAGGSGYTAATTISASGGCTWTGTALISQGVIVGVRTTAVGAGCGASTVSATDGGGGSGATFTVTKDPTLLTNRRLTLQSSSVTSVLQSSGGATSLSPALPILLQVHAISGEVVTLVSNGGTKWEATPNLLPIIAIGSLPPSNATTCTATYSGALVNVTGSVSGKWLARCDGSHWVAPDGATIN